jgi:hypothetical protein
MSHGAIFHFVWRVLGQQFSFVVFAFGDDCDPFILLHEKVFELRLLSICQFFFYSKD